MSTGMRTRLQGYGAALLFVALAAGLTFLAEPVLAGHRLLFFFAAVAGAALYAGSGPGLLATALSLLISHYLLREPEFEHLPRAPADVVPFMIFAAVALFMIAGGAALRRARTRAERARDDAERERDRAGELADRLRLQAAELERQAEDLQTQGVELEQQTHEAQALAEELEQSNEQLLQRTAEAEEAQERLAATLDSIGDHFVVYASDWRFVYLNASAKATLRALGKDPDALIGKNLFEEFPTSRGTLFETEGARVMRERRSAEWEEYYETPGAWLRIRAYPTPEGGIATYAQDVTLRRRAEAALQESELRKAAILDVSLDAVITMDHAGRVTEFNAAAERIFGYRREEVLGKEMAELIIPPHLRDRHHRGLRHYIATGEGPVLGRRIELTAMRADGSEFPVELAIIRLPVSGDALFTGFLRDVTDRRAAERERAELVEQERALRLEAEAANQTKAHFLATMSHELRTPLNAIGGFVELIERELCGPVTTEQREYLQRVRRNQQHLLGLITNILNFSRLEAGQVHYEIADVKLDELLRDVGGMIEPQARSRALAYEYEPCARELIVRADREKLAQILLNCLSNAVKFTDRGGRVRLTCDAVGPNASIRIEDTGIGIPDDKLNLIFEPFVQLDRGLARRAEGTGLGLAISRDLARAMDGDLTVRSAVGEGSVFTLTLPLAGDTAEDEGSGASRVDAGAATP